MEALLLLLLATTASALDAASSHPRAIPISYSYGGYPRIEANVTWGTPPQKVDPTIFDTGSWFFWVYGPKAIINDGSQYHYTLGPCNKTVTDFYNWPASKTHTKLNTTQQYSFSYGGNGKIVTAYSTIYDTFSFANKKWPPLTNNEVALSNFTLVTQLDDNCAIPESAFDHSILGMGPTSQSIFTGPSLRNNLLSQGKTSSFSFSMWMDKPAKSTKDTYQGTAIFGAVPSKSKYSGELVRLKLNPPSGTYVGYYVSTPNLTATSIEKPGKPQVIGTSDKTVKQCLLDSGTGQYRVPFSQKRLLEVTGLFQYNETAYFTAWNESCDSIPPTATLNYTFAGATAGKAVTIAVPIRSYARGLYDDVPGADPQKVCGLSLSAAEVGDCIFGAPFFTAAFAVFNDDMKQVALAQGGVSTGSTDGPIGLGPVTTIAAGQNIPGSV